MRILVLGAGELGLSILTALYAHHSKPSVSVLLRPLDSPSISRSNLLSTLSSLKVDIVYVNLTDPEVHTHFAGFDIVISATGFAAGPGTQRLICDAAIKAKVGWFFPWQFGVDYDKTGRGSSQPLFDEQLDVRDTLRGQKDVRWTITSTGIFTSFLFDPAFGIVVKDSDGNVRVNALGSWENQVTMTTAEDIGRLTAQVALDDKDAIGSGVVRVAGDTMSFRGIANALAAAGWEVERQLIDVKELEQARRERPDDVGPKYQLIWARNIGVSWNVEDSWNGRRGISVTNMEQWIKEKFRPLSSE